MIGNAFLELNNVIMSFKQSNNMKRVFFLILLFSKLGVAFAQSDFNLEQAVQYAVKHSNQLALQKLNLTDAEGQIKEYYAIGMPKLNAKVSYNYFIDVPTSILPDFISPSIYGILFKENLLPARDINFGSGVPVQFGTKNNLSASLEFNTLLFDGSFIVGLKAQQMYKDLLIKQVNQSEAEVRYQVSKAYMSALVLEETQKTLNKNKSNLEKVFQELTEINKAGFIEKLDVDRIELSLQLLNTELDKLNRLSEVTKNVLKFQMNYPVDQSINLTEQLNDLIQKSYVDLLDSNLKLSVKNRPEFQVIDQGRLLAEINVKRYKVSYFPSLFGFASHQQSLLRNNLFDSKDNKWFPTTVVGLGMNAPIFDGFDRKAKIARAKVLLDKTNIQMSEFERGVELEYLNAKTQYLNALNSLESGKKSLALAERIYETSKIKFREGVGSSIEITQSERDVYQAQAKLTEAQFAVINAKIDLDKALGKL